MRSAQRVSRFAWVAVCCGVAGAVVSAPADGGSGGRERTATNTPPVKTGRTASYVSPTAPTRVAKEVEAPLVGFVPAPPGGDVATGATCVFDVTGTASMDVLGDVDNVVVKLDVAGCVGATAGAVVSMNGVAWDVTITGGLCPGCAPTSWVGHVGVYFDDNVAPDGVGLFLLPGVVIESPGTLPFSSGGMIKFDVAGIPVIALPDGVLRMEFFEQFDDVDGQQDGNWDSGTLTIQVGVCGNGVTETGEACDGNDDAACPGACQGDCTCIVPPGACGDNVVDPGEACDGTDDAACPGQCLPNCTCPTPVCGNNITQPGEDCDGADDALCPGECQADCTCPPPVGIPTVSAWGMIVMAILLLGAGGVLAVRRRGSAAAGT
ncbi:MAG: IPTL-CTERM sorting domain-containing protein [Phycisphaerae bacterium]